MISIIAALDPNRVIGKDGKLPWHISEDLKNFKRLTSGATVIMGRRTFESIGRPLPNRNNIVISTTMQPQAGIDVCRSLPEAIEKAKSYNKDIFIIGGSRAYREALPIADRMYLSFVKKEYDGDAYFPEFDESKWKITDRKDFEEFELVAYERI